MASQDKANSVWPFDTLLSVSDHLYIKKCQLGIRKSDTVSNRLLFANIHTWVPDPKMEL